MTYLGSDRFVVRELEGFSKAMYGGSDSWPGLCITVIDRAYCCQVLRMWQTEEHHTGGNGPKTMTRDRLRGKLRAEAAEFCAALNTRGGRCTGGPVSPAVTLLTPAKDHPSLSPFDSGCPL